MHMAFTADICSASVLIPLIYAAPRNVPGKAQGPRLSAVSHVPVFVGVELKGQILFMTWREFWGICGSRGSGVD